MRKFYINFILLIIVSLTLTGCSSRIEETTILDDVKLANMSEQANQAYKNYTVLERNTNLHVLAKMIAKVINSNQNIKAGIGHEVGKMFDGDYDVLYDLIADRTFNSGKTLRSHLRGANSAVDQLTGSIPYLNIAIPVNFDQWEAYDGTIYVIPMRYDVNDTEIDVLYGYDGFGQKKAFYANQKPDSPVIVIGINERVDNSGLHSSPNEVEPSIQVQANGDGSILHSEMLKSVYLTNDQEPWYSGRAEVYSFWVSGNYDKYNVVDLPGVDYSGETYSIEKMVLEYSNFYNNEYIEVEFWEKDTGSPVNYIVSGEFISTWDGQGGKYTNEWKFTGWKNPDDDNLGKWQFRFDHANPESYSFGYCTVLMGYKERI